MAHASCSIDELCPRTCQDSTARKEQAVRCDPRETIHSALASSCFRRSAEGRRVAVSWSGGRGGGGTRGGIPWTWQEEAQRAPGFGTLPGGAQPALRAWLQACWALQACSLPFAQWPAGQQQRAKQAHCQALPHSLHLPHTCLSCQSTLEGSNSAGAIYQSTLQGSRAAGAGKVSSLPGTACTRYRQLAFCFALTLFF